MNCKTYLPDLAPRDFTASTTQATTIASNSDASLEGSHRVCLHDCLGWLGLHMNLLAKDHLLASLCCGLCASLDLANPRDHKLASALYLLCGNGCEAIHQL